MAQTSRSKPTHFSPPDGIGWWYHDVRPTGHSGEAEVWRGTLATNLGSHIELDELARGLWRVDRKRCLFVVRPARHFHHPAGRPVTINRLRLHDEKPIAPQGRTCVPRTSP